MAPPGKIGPMVRGASFVRRPPGPSHLIERWQRRGPSFELKVVRFANSKLTTHLQLFTLISLAPQHSLTLGPSKIAQKKRRKPAKLRPSLAAGEKRHPQRACWAFKCSSTCPWCSATRNLTCSSSAAILPMRLAQNRGKEVPVVLAASAPTNLQFLRF